VQDSAFHKQNYYLPQIFALTLVLCLNVVVVLGGGNEVGGGNYYSGNGYQGKNSLDKIGDAKLKKQTGKAHKDRFAKRNDWKSNEVAGGKQNRFKDLDSAWKRGKNKRNASIKDASQSDRIKFMKDQRKRRGNKKHLSKRDRENNQRLRGGNKSIKKRSNKKNAFKKSSKNFAKEAEYDDNVDKDSGALGYGMKGGYSGAGAPMHYSVRKHGQQHNLGKNMFNSGMEQMNKDNMFHNSFVQQDKKMKDLTLNKNDNKFADEKKQNWICKRQQETFESKTRQQDEFFRFWTQKIKERFKQSIWTQSKQMGSKI